MRATLRKTIFFIAIIIMAAAVPALSLASGAKPKAAPSAHPQLTDQEKLTPCAQCHKDATPDIYQEWYDSVHGIANVKCFQCHGTYENFRVEPNETNCAACHNKQYQKRPKGKKCWDCHPAHNFFVHK